MAAQATSTAATTVSDDPLLLGPSRYSSLGPPRPAGEVITPVGGWASLYQQLRQRRAELAVLGSTPAPQAASCGGGGGGGDDRGDGGVTLAASPSALSAAAAAAAAARAPPSSGRSVLAPGATRPRGGVRRTAMGPLLQALRAENRLTEG